MTTLAALKAAAEHGSSRTLKVNREGLRALVACAEALRMAKFAMDGVGCEEAMSLPAGKQPRCGHVDCLRVALALPAARAALAALRQAEGPTAEGR